MAAPRNTRLLWLGLFAGPVGWFLTLQGGYALAPGACFTQSSIRLYVMALAGLIVAALGTLLAWRGWQDAGAGGPIETPDPRLARARFLSALGLMGGLLFLVVIVAHCIAIGVLDPCDSP
jgi:hypothetical protein